MLLDIGVESSQVTILKEGRIMLSRFIPSGAHSADLILSSRFSVTEEQAAEIRSHERFSSTASRLRTSRPLRGWAIPDISEQLTQTMDYYRYNMGKEFPVNAIYLTGGGSLFEGLEEVPFGNLLAAGQAHRIEHPGP